MSESIGMEEVAYQEEQRLKSIIQIAPHVPQSLPNHKNVKTPTKNQDKDKKKRRFHCTVVNCSYSTPYGKDLSRHMRKHTGLKPYACQQCSKCYSRYDKLTTHIKTHDGIRSWKCTTCDYAGFDRIALKKHIQSHTNERPYKCQICPYAAKQTSQLVVHLRKHTGDSPYFCIHDECDAAFRTLSDLHRHSRIHTGQKPYICSFTGCSYRAAVKSNLNTHLKRHHSEKELPINKISKTLQAKDELRENSNSTIKQGLADAELTDWTLNSINSNPFNALSGIECTFGSEADTPQQGEGTTLENRSDSILLIDMDESKLKVSVPPTDKNFKHHTKKSRLLAVIAPSQDRVEPKLSTSLPFQYACKQCPQKVDTMELFFQHMKCMHKNFQKHPKSPPGLRIGRPHHLRKTTSKNLNLSENLKKLYDCTFCSASFVREDSLRCHMRQHSSLELSPLSFKQAIIQVPILPTTSINYNTPSTRELKVSTTPTSVITQNPNNFQPQDQNQDQFNLSNQTQLYLISPGGSTIQSIQQTNNSDTEILETTLNPNQD